MFKLPDCLLFILPAAVLTQGLRISYLEYCQGSLFISAWASPQSILSTPTSHPSQTTTCYAQQRDFSLVGPEHLRLLLLLTWILSQPSTVSLHWLCHSAPLPALPLAISDHPLGLRDFLQEVPKHRWSLLHLQRLCWTGCNHEFASLASPRDCEFLKGRNSVLLISRFSEPGKMQELSECSLSKWLLK